MELKDMEFQAAGRVLEVRVEAALADVLVVSCHSHGRHFQGVLLDCAKRRLPFGVSALHPAFANDDRLYSVSQRFLYQQNHDGNAPVPNSRPVKPKCTVRLRPRKVLCASCKGICNENSENVAEARKRKIATQDAMRDELIPKISRLHPDQIPRRTLKISFGEGEGTVVELPTQRSPQHCDKAARKALKKAKKQRRKAKHKKKRKEEEEEELEREDSPPQTVPGMEAEDSDAWVECSGEGGGVGSGDVVWGKLQGFPWWPGRVVAVDDEGGTASVAWFNSTTSSRVPHHRLAPFLDNFKVHFNKKKRGPYKEAVRQASLEAGGPLDPLATDPLAPASDVTLPPPLSSPPVNVLS